MLTCFFVLFQCKELKAQNSFCDSILARTLINDINPKNPRYTHDWKTLDSAQFKECIAFFRTFSNLSRSAHYFANDSMGTTGYRKLFADYVGTHYPSLAKNQIFWESFIVCEPNQVVEFGDSLLAKKIYYTTYVWRDKLYVEEWFQLTYDLKSGRFISAGRRWQHD
jgi:hypothetical protein